MKTITGSVVSLRPISLSKAAKVISNFAATENGAYIRRASISFNELKQIHREIENPAKSEKKHRNRKPESTAIGADESGLENGFADHEKRRKTKYKEEESKAMIEDVERSNRKSEEIEVGKGSNSSEKHKKKKKRKGEGDNVYLS